MTSIARYLAVAIAAVALSCGGSSDRSDDAASAGAPSRWGKWRRLYTVGGTLSGLPSSSSIGLQDDGGDDLTLTADGSFTFATSLGNGASYTVTIARQPTGASCSVANGSGTIARDNVTSVAVTCSATPPPATYAVGGTITGLTGTTVLQNDGGDDLTMTADGSFTFATRLAYGAPYDVTVAAQPSGESCTVTNGNGTMPAADVSVTVTCSAPQPGATYTVGGTVSGLTGTVVLENDGLDDLTVSANGAFTFATPLADGAVYDVTVAVEPSGAPCTITNRSGAIAGANVTDVAVDCQDTFQGYYAYAGTCIVNAATSTLTGECMDWSTCAIAPSTYCATGPMNPPTVQAYCGPTLDNTACWF